MDSQYVDAQLVREHLEMLSRFGIGHTRVAELSGISVSTIRNYRWKPKAIRMVMRAIADQIFQIEPSVVNAAAHALVDATGARRRLQALVARGWTQRRLSELLGVSGPRICVLLRAERIQADTYREIARVFELYWDVAPPAATAHQRAAAEGARRLAARSGWVPPMAWDDIDTDPEIPAVGDEELVDEVAIELACSGERVKLSDHELTLALARLEREGRSASEIARLFGVAERTVVRWRARTAEAMQVAVA